MAEENSTTEESPNEDEEVDAESTEETTEDEGTSEEETTEEEAREDPSQEIDYKAEDETERNRAEGERKKAEDAYKEREAKREDEEATDEGDDDKPLTRREMQSLIRAERQNTLKEVQESRAIEIARANTSSEEEAQAALTYWRTRVVPTGDLQEDVLFALGGLNRKRIVAQNAELGRALKGKDAVSDDTASTHRDAPQQGAPKLSATEKIGYKDYIWDGKRQAFKKQIGRKERKQFLFKDHKTGRKWIEVAN